MAEIWSQDLLRWGQGLRTAESYVQVRHTLDPIRQEARRLGVSAALLAMRSIPMYDPHNAYIDVVDIFSGCGGMSAGFRTVSTLLPSYRLLGAVDIDAVANATYRHNLGGQPACLDVRSIVQDQSTYDEFRSTLHREPGRPLVLIGCAPCQGFSSYRRDGATDERNSLMEAFAHLAVRLQPDALIMENVPELLSDRYWQFYERSRDVLEAGGYRVRARVYNLAEFGVPQERFRAAIVAMRRPFTMPYGFLDRPDFRTVRGAIGDLPPLDPGETIPDMPMHSTARHRASTIATIHQVPRDGGRRPFGAGPDGLRRAYYRTGKEAFEDVYGRLRWDRPSITITHYSRNPASGRFVHPEQDRGLSALEAALLQGFPSDYYFCGGFDDRFRQIGNAVPPRFAAYLAGHLLGEILSPEPATGALDPDIREPIGASFSRSIPGLKRNAVRDYDGYGYQTRCC